MSTRSGGELPTLVIGAGVVGLTCAVALARAGRWVVIVDRERHYGRGTSSRNSGVIHAGLYYEPGSLKAKLCVDGRERLYGYARERGVPHRRCGKVVVATEASELGHIEAIAARARANGVHDVELIGADELHRLAPPVCGVGALFSPSTGIVDVHALMDALATDATRAGVDFVLGTSLEAASLGPGGWRIALRSATGEVEEAEVEWVVNCAGLYADEVATLALPPAAAEALRLDWTRGNYFSIRPAGAAPVDLLVYPCPPRDRGLGIHLTLDMDGGQRLGPDVEVLPARVEDYSVDPARGGAFLAAARRYLPHLTADDLAPAFAGIRPQRRMPVPRDFYVAEESAAGAPHWLNLVGIESPGLTAAFALAEMVSGMVAAG